MFRTFHSLPWIEGNYLNRETLYLGKLCMGWGSWFSKVLIYVEELNWYGKFSTENTSVSTVGATQEEARLINSSCLCWKDSSGFLPFLASFQLLAFIICSTQTHTHPFCSLPTTSFLTHTQPQEASRDRVSLLISLNASFQLLAFIISTSCLFAHF